MKKVGIRLFLFLAVIRPVGAADYDPQCDVNRDFIIDARDIFLIQQHWHGVPEEITIELPGLPADATPLVMVRLPDGSFWMGSNEDPSWSWCYPCEQPVHTVSINYDLYVGKYEVTQAQWQAVVGINPAHDHGVGNNYPVYYVSWEHIRGTNGFLDRLNNLTEGHRPAGLDFALPSEAEWEYACRAGTGTRFSFGASICSPTGCTPCDLDSYAWWCGNNSPSGSKPVGQKPPNPFGLHDMHGNVWEWCEDDWHNNYAGPSRPDDGSPWIESPRTGLYVLRGGYWHGIARNARSSCRTGLSSVAYYDGGFRVVLVGAR